MERLKNHGKIPWSKLHNIGSQISASWPEINAIILSCDINLKSFKFLRV